MIHIEGHREMLNSMFIDTYKIYNWYIGLITSSGSDPVYGDTFNTHSGWTEFNGYTGSNRRLPWRPGTSNSRSSQNTTPIRFDFTDSGIVKGFFVVGYPLVADIDDSVKNYIHNILLATMLFDTPMTVTPGDYTGIVYEVQET